MSRLLLLVALSLPAVGCMRPPRNLAGEFPPVTVRDAQRSLDAGARVRWGGTLVQTTPQREQTCFEVVSRPLDRQARPEASDESAGRFIACAPGFYDPSVYGGGREVTVVGALDGETTRQVGGFAYRYPVVAASTVHLWEEREARRSGWAPGIGISIGGVFGSW